MDNFLFGDIVGYGISFVNFLCNSFVLYGELDILLYKCVDMDVVLCMDKYLGVNMYFLFKFGFIFKVVDSLKFCIFIEGGFCVFNLIESVKLIKIVFDIGMVDLKCCV